MYGILVHICEQVPSWIFGTMFTFKKELYQMETRGHNQFHLFLT